jgi:hypothetical protein
MTTGKLVLGLALLLVPEKLHGLEVLLGPASGPALVVAFVAVGMVVFEPVLAVSAEPVHERPARVLGASRHSSPLWGEQEACFELNAAHLPALCPNFDQVSTAGERV